MCGRARCTLNPQQVARACGFSPSSTTLQMDRFRPTYNASPGNYLPVAMLRGPNTEEEPVVHCMKWGLVPAFTGKHEKPDHFRMFNARSESVREKASFRRLVPKNRCLVVVDGFYEWKKDGPKKQPYYIHFKDQRPLVFAALYDTWVNSEGEVLPTFTILTTSSSSALQWLHDRMPVVLGNMPSINEWLTSPVSKLDSLLRPYEGSDLVWYPVTPAMGKTSFDGPECIKELKLSDSKPISNFFAKKSGGDKVKSSFEAQNVSDVTSKLVMTGNLKEELLSGEIDEPPMIKQVYGVTEAPHIQAMKEEPYYEQSLELMVNFTHDGEVLGTEHAKDIKNGVEEEPRDSDHGGSRRESEARGIKREHSKIDTVHSKLHVPHTKEHAHPSAKRGRCVKAAGDGQATLFSFFGKK